MRVVKNDFKQLNMNASSLYNKQNTPSPLGRARAGLKVCGMKYPENIIAVANLQPDYLGFIFHKNSPRFFDRIIPELPKTIKKVGIFVNTSEEYIIKKIEEYQLNAIQLHGDESLEFCKQLKELCHAELVSASHYKDKIPKQVRNDISIIKVFSIKDEFEFEKLQPYEGIVDYFLFDTKGKLPGGNGYTFDWSVLKDYPSTTPFFLSGGIGLEETDKIISFLERPESRYCHALDVNSKFEIAPGQKHIEQLKQFKNKLSDYLDNC